MGRMQDKVVLITAAADGIGLAAAHRLASEGAKMVVSDINADGVFEIAEQEDWLGLHHDAGSETDWRKVLKQVTDHHGRLDVLVNNAGIGQAPGDIENQSLEAYQNVMRVSLDSVFLGCKLAIELMKERGGAIVNMSSIHGIKAAPHEAAYTAAKAGVRMLTKSVAAHCAQSGYGIRVNSIHPGYILTSFLKKWIEETDDSEALRDSLIAQHPIGFLGEPEDIANAVLFLSCDESRFMTGSELVVDGGFSL